MSKVCSATLEATPNSCYKFKNWTNAKGVVISTDNPLSVTMVQDTTLTANFITTPTTNYTLTLNRNPANAGTVKDNGSYPSGTKVPIEATVTDNCYVFKNWTYPNGTQFSTKQKDTVTLTKNDTLIANFVQVTYPVTLIVSNDIGGIISYIINPTLSPPIIPIMAFISKKTYLVEFRSKSKIDTLRFYANDTFTTKAPILKGYKFVNWVDKDENVISTDDPIKLVVVSDTSIKPIYEIAKKGKTEKIEEIIKSNSFSFKASANNYFLISFEMLKPYKMKILLVDSKGKKVRNVFDGRAPKGLLEKQVNTKNLAKGEYLLQIFIGDEHYIGAKIII